MDNTKRGRPRGRAHFCAKCGAQALTKNAVKLLLFLSTRNGWSSWVEIEEGARIAPRSARIVVKGSDTLFSSRIRPSATSPIVYMREIKLSAEGRRVAEAIAEEMFS